ncbi:MAG: S-layer homology domain-containing protein [Acetivibrionales bacterium]
MKKSIALFLSIILLMAVLIPAHSFAAPEQGLEKAIKAAKRLFDIPEDYKFDYSVGTDREKTVWYLDWRDEKGLDGSVNVSVDEYGTIISYNKYKPYKPGDSDRNRFPKVSNAEAKNLAESFIKKVNPDALSQVEYREENQNSIRDREYYMSFIRMVNGIPFYNNNIRVSVDKETGEILGYYYNWSEDAVFPSPAGVISIEDAQNAYKQKLGVSMIYKYGMDNENIRIYTVYTPMYSNDAYAIDAFTGEKTEISNNYYISYDEGVAQKSMEAADAAGSGRSDVTLTPEELEAIKKVSSLITANKAEKIARDSDILELDNNFKLTNSSLSRSWPDRDSFNWYLNFSKEPTDEDSFYRYVSVTIDAVNGEINNFYISRPYNQDEKANYNMNESKAEVEKFLKGFKPEAFSQTEYYEVYNSGYVPLREEEQKYFSFRYTRKVNDIPFPSNGITVGFDAVSGKVTDFYMEWFGDGFTALGDTMSMEKAYEQLFGQIGLELQYKYKNNRQDDTVLRAASAAPEVQLVYALKLGKPYDIDAFTGILLNYNGEEYKETKVPEYSDIEHCFAKNQIMALAEYGIYLEGTQFKPNEHITQKDFFALLSKVVDRYYGPVIKSGSSEKVIDDMYNNLIRLGIVTSEEKAPGVPVSREDGVKFLIRALNYDEVADIKGIYKSIFKDEGQMNPDLTGYIAIASGLGIVNGNSGYFRPKDNVTRAEAAVLIYNYLQR